jgi:dTDP-glucose 4,6-dehydratase/UDP-glucuronate decarboxylase
MNILITGGAGFIGSQLTKKLLEKNYQVIVVDNLITGCKKNIEEFKNNKNFTFIKADVVKPLANLPKIDYLFHLASPASPNHQSKISYHQLALETMLVNTTGTLELLKLAKKHQAKFLFASTSEVYGNPLVHPQNENYFGNVNPVGPRAVYDEAKRFGETLTSYFVKKERVDGKIARIFNTYGPNMRVDDKRMVVNFITQALKNEPITIFGNGKQTRSLCYVDDLVDGLIKLMFNKNTCGEVVNLGNPEEHTVLEYAKIIKRLAKSKSEIVFFQELPPDDPQKRKPDISKAKKLLKWEPKIALEEGLKKTICYFKTIL